MRGEIRIGERSFSSFLNFVPIEGKVGAIEWETRITPPLPDRISEVTLCLDGFPVGTVPVEGDYDPKGTSVHLTNRMELT